RDFHVTGVQTCALPISPGAHTTRRARSVPVSRATSAASASPAAVRARAVAAGESRRPAKRRASSGRVSNSTVPSLRLRARYGVTTRRSPGSATTAAYSCARSSATTGSRPARATSPPVLVGGVGAGDGEDVVVAEAVGRRVVGGGGACAPGDAVGVGTRRGERRFGGEERGRAGEDGAPAGVRLRVRACALDRGGPQGDAFRAAQPCLQDQREPGVHPPVGQDQQ